MLNKNLWIFVWLQGCPDVTRWKAKTDVNAENVFFKVRPRNKQIKYVYYEYVRG